MSEMTKPYGSECIARMRERNETLEEAARIAEAGIEGVDTPKMIARAIRSSKCHVLYDPLVTSAGDEMSETVERVEKAIEEWVHGRRPERTIGRAAIAAMLAEMKVTK